MSGKTVTIDYCPQKHQIQIHESNSRNRVVVIGRRGGKTLMAINEIIKKSIEKPGLYWFVAPSYKQAKAIGWRILKNLLKVDESWTFNEVELRADHPSGTRIELKGADNEDSLRGQGLNGVVLDECAFMKANVWPEIIRPMLADTSGWALFISTPKGRDWFYECFLNANKFPESWEAWKYPTSVNEYIKPEEIALAKQDMSERLFMQEFLAEFIDDETGVFKKIDTCSVGSLKDPVSGRFYVMGVDLAKHHDFTVICVMDAVTRELVHFDRFNQILWTEQKDRIQKIAGKYNNAKVWLDSTGVGDPILDDLKNANVSVEGFQITHKTKCQLIEKLSVAIEQRLITFPKIDVLVDELKAFEYFITDEGRIKYSAPSGKHDDCVIALALATWGIRSDLYATRVIQEMVEQEQVDRVGIAQPQEETIMASEPGVM